MFAQYEESVLGKCQQSTPERIMGRQGEEIEWTGMIKGRQPTLLRCIRVHKHRHNTAW